MKKTLLSIAVLYGAGVFITPYFAGKQIEQNTQQFFASKQHQRLVDNGVELTLKQYDKGYFSSTADIALRITDRHGKLIYQNEFRTDIAHAPLSLSGFNAVTIDANEAAKADGLLGKHLPKDFIHATGSKSLTSLISGSHSVDVEIDTTPLKTEADGNAIDFDGLQAQITTPASEDDLPTFTIESKKWHNVIAAEHAELNIKPFSIHGDLTDDKTYTVSIEDMDFNAKSLKTDEHVSWGFDDLIISIGALSEQEMQAPYLANISASIDDYVLDFKIDDGDENGHVSLDEAELLAGFIEQDDAYAFQLTLKADPKISGKLAEEAALNPTDIDIEINIAPFDHQFLQTHLSNAFSRASAQPQRAPKILIQQIMGIISENVMKQDLRAKVDATIDTSLGKFIAVDGEIHEHLTTQNDAMNLVFDPKKAVPKYFHDSHLNMFLSKQLIDIYLMNAAFTGRNTPPNVFSPWIDADGDAKLKLKINEQEALLNGKPAPF